MSYLIRTLTLAFATAAFAIYAMAQATSNTAPNQNQYQQGNQAIQTNNTPASATAPAANARPRAGERAPVVNRGQAIRGNQVQPNPNRNVITQPNVPTQPVLPDRTSTLRPPVSAGVVDRTFQNNPTNLQNRTVIQPPQTLRERIAARQVVRAPDIGLWFGRPVRDALVINDIATTGPIARLGFREGDRMVSVNRHPVLTEADFTRFLLTGEANPIDVVVFRDGRNQSIVVDPTVFFQESAPVVEPLEQFGVVLDDRFNDRIVVWRVLPGTPAFYAGFRPGDVITTVSGQPFTTRTQFEQAISAMPAGEVALQVRRGDRARDLVVDVPTFQQAVPHVSARPVAPDKKQAEIGVNVPNNDVLKTAQPLDPARPNLQGGPREPRESIALLELEFQNQIGPHH